MKYLSSRTAPPVIPTASMADIAFLLIIFFMLTFTIEVDRTQVTLPSTNIRIEVPKKAAYISVTESGQIKVSNGEETSYLVNNVDDVLSFATNVVNETPDKEFALKADNGVPYRYIDEIIDALKQSRAKVIFMLSQQATTDGA